MPEIVAAVHLVDMQHSLFEIAPTEPVEEAVATDYREQRNIARGAEFLVAFDISRRGYTCFTVGEGLRYDLLADIGGLRRIQIKSRLCAEFRGTGSVTTSYTFGSSKDLRTYVNDIELFAFVAMDVATVLYLLPNHAPQSLHVAASKMTKEASELSWASVMRAWEVPQKIRG